MATELIINSKSVLDKLQMEAIRLGLDPLALIEKLIDKSIGVRVDKETRYQKGLSVLLNEMLAIRADLFIDLKKKVMLSRKPVIQNNVYDTGVDLVMTKSDLGNDRTMFYNREYTVMLTHPDATKIVTFVLYYSLGILMTLQFSVSVLKNNKLVDLHSEKYDYGDPNKKITMVEGILNHIKTLELDLHE